MSSFYETNLKLYSEKSQPKICIISDIHFSYRVKSKKLENLAKLLRAKNPDYIFIPGDLIDSVDMIREELERERLLDWLKSLGEIATVIISKGNHDNYKKHHIGLFMSKWSETKNTNFENDVSKIKNVHYLDNSIFKDKKIYVLGLTLSNDYYSGPNKESAEKFLRDLKNIDQNLINTPKEKLCFALIHSPHQLTNKKIRSKLKNFDYLISGHMHNGLVLPFLDKIWPSDRGLINAQKQFFAKNTRLSSKTLKHNLIVSGAITTWHESTGIFHNLNILYPACFTTLDFTTDKKFKNPKITKNITRFKS
jgi:predicted MPP superfamily phosphohydrolase